MPCKYTKKAGYHYGSLFLRGLKTFNILLSITASIDHDEQKASFGSSSLLLSVAEST